MSGPALLTRLDGRGRTGPRLAVKDIIDVAGVPTTAGCRAVAERAEPAAGDAACLAGARAADARLVGKANLHELAYGATGVNRWFGTPENPRDPSLVPGGSSSGSAVAVATEEADVALGSDTGGSVRIPSACCGTAGLKTTYGRVPLDGVWPLSQSLDTVGPMARDVAGLVLGMELLEPGFRVAADPPLVVGRFRGLDADPAVDAAVDAALAAAELDVVDLDLPGWPEAHQAARVLLGAEAWRNDRHLLEGFDGDAGGVGTDVVAKLRRASQITEVQLTDARALQRRWQAELRGAFERVQAVALPTLVMFPPPVGGEEAPLVLGTAAVNLAGAPSLVLPVPSGRTVPASLQLVGPWGGEEDLLALGGVVEAAVG